MPADPSDRRPCGRKAGEYDVPLVPFDVGRVCWSYRRGPRGRNHRRASRMATPEIELDELLPQRRFKCWAMVA